MTAYFIWLERTKALKNSEKRILLKRHSTPEAVFNDTIKKYSGTEAQMTLLDQAKRIEENCQKNDIEIITCFDKRYRPCNHFALYAKGPFIKTKLITLIGSRKPSREGILNTELLCEEMIGKGYTISGGHAQGIESIARCTARKLKGRHMSFLTKSIKPNGAVVPNETQLSPFPPGTPFSKYQYGIRNALLIHWSDALVLIESTPIGHSYNLAIGALKQKKKVSVIVPTLKASAPIQTDQLIEEGALPLESPFKSIYKTLAPTQKDILNAIALLPASTQDLAAHDDLKYALLELESLGIIGLEGDGLWRV